MGLVVFEEEYIKYLWIQCIFDNFMNNFVLLQLVSGVVVCDKILF